MKRKRFRLGGWFAVYLISHLSYLISFSAQAEDAPTYTLGAPLQPGFVWDSSSSGNAGNRWMNGAFVASGGVATNVAVTAVDQDTTSQEKYSIVSAEVGFGWQRTKPDYYLADLVQAPDDVDWNATKTLYDACYALLEGTGKTPGFLLNPDPNNPCVYAIAGGQQKFPWVLKDGTTNAVDYTIGTTCGGRPRRIYWTDSPYNAPPVSMEGKFVRIFDNGGVTKIVRATVTNDVNGVQTVTENTIVSGVYVDASSQVMYAKGKPQGQFVLVYYDTGSYNNILCVEAIEAACPEAIACRGVIGQELKPTGRGYEIDGLTANVTAGIDDADDDYGDYLYQHAGQESYSPKNKAVFPLRPSVGKRWKQEIYWMETDPMGVQWPFELDQYESDWPARGYLYVRGDLDGDTGAKIYIPTDYTASLQSYQEPAGHAVQVDGNNAFYTKDEGWSLLKLTANDNIWFLPIHSVNRSNAAYYTLATNEVAVGQEIRLQGGSRSGLTFGAKELAVASDDVPGYLYRPASGGAYNVDLYHETTNATDSSTSSATGTTLPSALFPVNESAEPLEVWWSSRVQLDDMPYWIDVPCLPQVFRPVWPGTTEAPTIVLASQQGSAGESLFQQYGAATFDRANARLMLLSRKYFPNGTGMVTFWTRPSKDAAEIDGPTNAPTVLLQLGTQKGDALTMRIGSKERFELLLGTNTLASVAMPKIPRPNIWTHVALGIENASKYTLALNAEPVASGTLENAGFLAETLDRCVVGRVVEFPSSIVKPVIDDSSVVTNVPAPAESFVECDTWDSVTENLLAGRNVKLSKDVKHEGSVTLSGSVMLDLNGHELTGKWFMFSIGDGGVLTICDSSPSGCGMIKHKNDPGILYAPTLVNVLKGGKLILNGGVLNGGTCYKQDRAGAIAVEGGVFEMNGGSIQETIAVYADGGAVDVVSGSFVMNGGLIAGCKAVNGGGVLIRTDGTFTMNGGCIDDCGANSGDYCGGGICVKGRATINGGRIVNCRAREGGGIAVRGAAAHLTVNKGLIASNYVYRSTWSDENNYCLGGGIGIDGGTCVLNGGFLVANKAVGNTGDAALCRTPRHAAIGGHNGGQLIMNGGAVLKSVCENGNAPMGMLGGSITLAGGLFDFVPISENVNAEGLGAFDEPFYLANEKLGLYRIMIGAAIGRQVSEIIFRSELLSASSVKEARYKILTGVEKGISGYYSFRPGEDLVSIVQKAAGADFRRFTERTTGIECLACNAVLETPGAPGYHPCIIGADATPSVYYQNIAGFDGYNPNEEHAFVKAGAGGYVAWALRGDLNTDGSSKPAVLVEYEKDGEAKMQFLHVAITNAVWPRLAGTCTVAQMLPGPQPITLMDDPWLAEDYWDRDPAHPEKPGVAYRDRKGQLWARCAGTLPVYMYYRMQEGFWFPQLDLANQPAAGTAIPWLSLVANPKAVADPVHTSPAVWTWEAKWPENYNEMKIGQTLYTAADGLPGVYNMRSASVIYPTRHEESGPTETVALVDPTVERSVTLDLGSAKTADEYLKLLGLSTDPNGGLNLRKGKYTFNELPPHLTSRVWVDASNCKLCLVGKYDKKNAGASILYVNVLTSSEHLQIRNVVPEAMRSGKAWESWCAAADALGAKRVEPNDMTVAANELKTTYSPRDSYALAAVGNTNWVVLVENDAPTTNETRVVDGVETTVNLGVNAGDAINMHVFKVVPKYYAGRIVTKEDEQNLLSQRLTVMYTESFGGESDQYVFEWKSASPGEDGTMPEDYDNDYVWRSTNAWADAATPRITVGEQGDTLVNMVNKYWICRYRAKDATCPAWGVMGDQWSGWCAPPALAEGWVQRVLNNVTPFNQLMTDLYENPAETAVSMIQKAGKPYTGDVALNQDALLDCGLIELYETMFNKAESMSLLLNVKNSDVNKQLLLVAERLGDLYTVLGDEAYSDAKNPTIGFGMNIASVENQPSVDFGAASSGLFCFDNQVRTLLDEELALLRGRTAESLPYVTKHFDTGDRRVMNTAPYYNRLLWNFTKGITAGEVAYAVNYNIEGTETTALSEEQAAAIYPQGHGDAYGHYLSALKGWYRLLRNPNFNWVRAQGEMNVADSAVNVDYYEEAKFSEAALKVARTAADVVDLTARKAYGDDGAKLAGYMDETEERAFGYGEWANRGAYGALVNWAVANSVLPADETTVTTGVVDGVETTFRDEGLKRIDRGTVDELAELCTQAAAIQAAEDRIDAGQNPLGLNEDAIPFDISPIGANDGTMTHYEQIRERAGTAVANARAILERAQDYSSRLTMIQEGADDYVDQIEEQELDYNQELIGYYGTPYSDDIGPGKTYAQGYEGPDTVHYMWMDISKFNLTSEHMDQTTVTVKDWTEMNDILSFNDMLKYYEGDYKNRQPGATTITLDLSSAGIVIKPANITGTRAMQGSIQEKYADFLLAYKDYCNAIWTYDDAIDKLNKKTYGLKTLYNMKEARQALEQIGKTWEAVRAGLEYAADSKIEILQTSMDSSDAASQLEQTCSDLSIVAGVACGSNPKGIANQILAVPKESKATITALKRLVLKEEKLIYALTSAEYNNAVGIYDAAITETETDWEYGDKVRELINAINNACWDAQAKARTVQVAIEAYKSEVAKAEQVLEKREANRKKYVNKIAQWRYNDMFFRLLRNQSLTRYTAAFDLAQKYVWEAAKAYGYETGLLDDEEGSGAEFLNQIICSRSLGSFDADGNPVVGDVGDTGLSGLLAQMDANWLVLKPRLGINNPQEYATWFSLRGECFRILPGSEGDAAWAKELTKYWVDDITSNADFIRHCQPFQSQFGLKDKEPGLVIPFETTIDFAKNFFGKDLAGEDNAYDSTWYATRIYAAGLWFDGYNAKAEGYRGKALLANTPVAYLVPMGTDCMRVPGLEDGEVLGFNVVDQVIAAPYAIGSQHLNDLGWFPMASQGDLGGADATTKIRKHPSFRAYFDPTGGEPTDDALDCTRLVGRSVWNTRWMLVIPAGSMNADRDKALSVFINGSDVNRDGKLDLKPVSDIKIGFRTYSNSGN